MTPCVLGSVFSRHFRNDGLHPWLHTFFGQRRENVSSIIQVVTVQRVLYFLFQF